MFEYAIWILKEEKQKAKRTLKALREAAPHSGIEETIKHYRERVANIEKAIKTLKESEDK